MSKAAHQLCGYADQVSNTGCCHLRSCADHLNGPTVGTGKSSLVFVNHCFSYTDLQLTQQKGAL